MCVCVSLNVAAQDLTCLYHISSTDQVALNFGCFLIEHFLQAKEELMLENQRLKDENGALIRVITKLSKWRTYAINLYITFFKKLLIN